MRYVSGNTTKYIYFVAVDATDLKTFKTGLTTFTVYRSRNGAAAAAYTTPTVNETDVTNMPGVYELLLDEDMTIDSGDDSQEVVLRITHAGMAPVTRTFELYRPKITAGSTSVAQTGDSFARLGAPAGASVSADVAAIKADTAAILVNTGTDGVVVAAGSKTGYSLSTSGNEAVADQVLDEAMSGHVASGSLGAALQPTEQGTAQAGGADTITLRSGASASNNYYNKQKLRIVAGTGAGQSEFISSYVGATKVATMGAAWVTQPDNTSIYVIDGGGTIPGASAPTADQNAAAVWNKLLADHIASGSFGQVFSMFVKRRGTAQAGGASTITLDAGASATDNFYRYDTIAIVSGTGAGQGSRQISGYVGSSKVATVSLPWTTQPDNTSVFMVSPLGVDAATVAQIAAGVWDEARSSHVTAGTFGEYTNADMLRISGDATAANNAEAFFDGTGYAGTNNVIPSVTTVTGNVNGNVAGSVGSVTGAVGSVTGAVGSVTGAVASVTGAVGSVTGNVGGNVTGSVGSLAAQAKADVNAEVVDALDVDTYAQPGQGTPAATNTIRTMLSYLFKAWRNRTDQTATEYRLFNDDAVTVDHKATASDNGTTASRGEVATGP